MDVKTAAKVLKVCEATVRNKCDSGEFIARKIPSSQAHGGFVWDIDHSFIMSLAAARFPIRQKPEKAEKEEEEKEASSEDAADREIIVNSTKSISKKEAERIIKQEEAIRKQRENMIADGKIIFVDQINEAVSVHFGAMLQDLCALPDVWLIKYGLTPAQATQFTTDIKISLKTTWSKIKAKVEECENIAKVSKTS